MPVVPPYHLTKILKLCQTSFYELKVIVLMKEKLIPVSLKPNLNLIKIGQKLVRSCGPPLPTGRGACDPPLPLDLNFETLSNIVLLVESHCFDETKPYSSQFKAKFESYKNSSKTGGVLWSPLTNW